MNKVYIGPETNEMDGKLAISIVVDPQDTATIAKVKAVLTQLLNA